MKNIIYLLVVVVLISACKKTKQEKYSVTDFENTVNIKGIPSHKHKLEPFGFSDMGAWHGYALAPKDSVKYNGGFVGPLSMRMYGEWISKSLVKLKLTDLGSNKVIDLSKAEVENSYYPGYLKQSLKIDGLSIDMKLFFISNRSSLQLTTIENLTEDDRNIKIAWYGELMSKDATVKAIDNGLHITISAKQEDFLKVEFQQTLEPVQIINSTGYLCQEKSVIIKPKGVYESVNRTSHYFSPKEESAEKDFVSKSMKNASYYFFANNERWSEYLNMWFSNSSKELTKEKKRTAVKCMQTLLTNWRSPAGDLKHDGVFPSASYQGFYGFWSWDSWKHAVALTKFHPELAKNSMLSMFDYQDKYGMIADCIYYDSKDNNWRDTKAPLAAWAVWEIYKSTNDKDFVKLMYPKLVKYHEWWYNHRDVDKNGICEYGSTDGSIIAAKWESGMDNAVRFDSAVMVKTNDVAWSMNQESVDLNAYLYDEKLFLAKMSTLLGNDKAGELYLNAANKLQKAIQTTMFDKESGFFYDIDLMSKEMIKIKGPEGWIPLWTKLATKEQAQLVKNAMMDTKEFNCKIPCPTLTSAHPKFNPLKGYWRGPVWLDQFYYGVKGLEKYGFKKESSLLTEKLFQNGEGIIGDSPIRENYHPVTGGGLNANNFSWSAAHILMLLEN